MEKKRRKASSDKGRKKLILLLDAVLILGLIAAAVVLVVNLSNRKDGAAAVQGAAAGQTQQVAQQEGAAPTTAAGESAAAQTYAAALSVNGDGTLDAVDFAVLNQAGVPAVGWLYSPNTPLSYPVMQYLDNEYYMERNEQDKKDKNGAIYLDCRNAAELADAQIMIYGNPMEDGSMFGSLVEYRSQAYFAEHPCLYLYTGEKTYRIDVFAANTASPEMANYPTWFETDASRTIYINGLRESSFIQSDMTIAADATLIALVTCSDFDAGENARFVVHGVLTEA